MGVGQPAIITTVASLVRTRGRTAHPVREDSDAS